MGPTEKDIALASTDSAHLERKGDDTLKGGDEALNTLDPDGEEISEEEYKAVLKKIDWHLTPVLMVINMIQIVDKNVRVPSSYTLDITDAKPDSWCCCHLRLDRASKPTRR